MKFNLKITKVTDGDTFKFENLDAPVRLLCIDTEETFKTADAEQKTNEISQYWDEFYKKEVKGIELNSFDNVNHIYFSPKNFNKYFSKRKNEIFIINNSSIF